ncbi:hypothetical protein OIU74_011780 [Salix koriyanagi]|uniref:Pentatricopeptide repeat-containing protein n=1 Tax=Salix koriyanagi TaxID=2511006 RepID=A0A9Q0YV41_9ROSI|nr:hypothetical protein OIU74_011780 [Salix koriyanagi]
MKASGVIPDTFVLNMIIKAYAKCLEVDEAVRVFREMGLYGCEANAYSYGYLVKGLCGKERSGQGLGFYKEMKGKGVDAQWEYLYDFDLQSWDGAEVRGRH